METILEGIKYFIAVVALITSGYMFGYKSALKDAQDHVDRMNR